MPSDLEIAQNAHLTPIADVAQKLSLADDDIDLYGRHIAKINAPAQAGEHGTYVVVTALTPTPLGEGKTTTSIGLTEGLGKLGKRAAVCLRQPSLGPVFGIKGGAAGAGYSQVVPMEAMNLHLTGDFHAVTSAHNLLAAMLDNHLKQGNELGIDPFSIMWGRVLDMNDRALREIVVGLGGKSNGVPRQSGFSITAASEVMTALSLSTDLGDLRARLGRIVVGFTHEGQPVTAEDIKAAGAMAVLLRDAVRPNLLQTLEGQPALVHCGPFGNIATGNNSIIADQIALERAEIVVTEAGFGADLGFERFVNVKCRTSGLAPDAAVIVCTVRALKAHAGCDLAAENPEACRDGLANLAHHLRIVRDAGVTPVIAINAFPDDHASEHTVIEEFAADQRVACAVSTHVADGGDGAIGLAEAVLDATRTPTTLRYTYELSDSLEAKLDKIATKIYQAGQVKLTARARADLETFTKLGYGELPMLIAKTPLSTTASPKDRGVPQGWTLPIREVKLAAGAGYVYALSGTIQTMPGLGKHPAAERIDITPDGRITGLF